MQIRDGSRQVRSKSRKSDDADLDKLGANVMEGFAEYFEELEDPRMASKIHHSLLTVIMIAVLGALCGAEGWADLAAFAAAKRSFLATFLDLSNGVPGKDTFRRVFEALSPHSFRKCFLRWTATLTGALVGKHLAVDGKTLRAALAHRDMLPLHLVHAWVVDNQVLFGQMCGAGKGQELASIPQLLGMLDIRGATITIDALGCQRNIAQQIIEHGADYILSVKDNQPTLHADAGQRLRDAREAGLTDAPDLHTRTEESGHGRHEVREAWIVHDMPEGTPAHEWPGAKSLVLIERTRTRGEETERATHVYISSVKDLRADAALRLIRNHWNVENGLHWTLDVAFQEDRSRIHSVNGAQNFALVRRVALNALKREKLLRHGIRTKQKACGWDHVYLLSVLHLMTPPDEGVASP
jgi:predicted transposase YbfD/YdcC